MAYSVSQLAKMIDHSLLHPTMTDKDLEEGCALALRYHTASVCVKPYAVKRAAELLRGADVLVCTVIGFPHGGQHTDIKVAETLQACRDGATEIDMVVNIGKVKGGDWEYIRREIDAVNKASKTHGAIVKVIFENDYLTDTEKVRLCEICTEVAVAFVKTSTGYGYVKGADGRFSTQGATISDLELMRRSCPVSIQVKAAGGVRTYAEMLRAIDAGATRIGATATQTILDEAANGDGNTLVSSGKDSGY
jgi:deoxyribose-phosphate aldolase